jgi:deoxyribose-phosphate aldolase
MSSDNSFDTSLARVIDHTLLKPEATLAEIERLCGEAKTYGFASVCVNPSYVARCSQLLHGSGINVCTVIGFPLGATSSQAKAYEAGRAISDGARELDMVINIGRLKSGDDLYVLGDIQSVVNTAKQHGAITKVIIETALLTDLEKIRACRIAKQAGADFVKTSTGFAGGGATREDIHLMRQTVGASMGVKASGGIRTRNQALLLLQAGATRIGASASVNIVTEQNDPRPAGY